MPVDLMFVEDLLLVHSISSLFSHMAEVGGGTSLESFYLFIFYYLELLCTQWGGGSRGLRIYTTVHMWKSWDKSVDSTLSFHLHVGSWEHTQVGRPMQQSLLHTVPPC